MMSTYQTQNSRLLWMIIGGISVVVVLFRCAMVLAQKDQQSTTTATQPAATVNSKPLLQLNQQQPAAKLLEPIQLVEESIIKDPLPANDSLAKEEIANWMISHQQLKDQQQELKQQHDDVDAPLA